MLRLGLNSAGRSLVGWVGGFGLCLLAGRSAPFALPIPKLRSCCSAETAYEQQLGNLGMGRVEGRAHKDIERVLSCMNQDARQQAEIL